MKANIATLLSNDMPNSSLASAHAVRWNALSGSVIPPRGTDSVPRGLCWVEGLIILSLFPSWLTLARGDDRMCVDEIQFLDDEVCVTLVGLDLPACRGAPQDSIDKSP